MAGRLGYPHLGFPEKVQKIILKEVVPIKRGTRPGDSLPADDFKKEEIALKERLGRDVNREEVISSLLYPKVFGDYLDYVDENSIDVKRLPSDVFWYGMTVGQKTIVPESDEFKGDTEITLKRVGPITHGSHRELTFSVTVNGKPQDPRSVKVKDLDSDGGFSGPMADPSDASQIGSPMTGSVEKVIATEGQTVEKGDKLAVVGAMKMEVDVSAPFPAKVKKALAVKGAKYEEGGLMFVLEAL